MLLTHLLREDGSEVVVQANADPFWVDRPVGGAAKLNVENLL